MAYPIRSNKGDASVLKTSISVAPRILTSARRQESCRAENVKVETQQGTKQIIPSASILWVMILDPPIESLQVTTLSPRWSVLYRLFCRIREDLLTAFAKCGASKLRMLGKRLIPYRPQRSIILCIPVRRNRGFKL
uniref:Uncharacterized protein n=1 Tax=Coccidioides posadasii RMSCC 3488 TaxID=454284 RepID=A0A0J6FKL4_COCPO|nr:hypothetical protein CPAG_05705 [Coccidioides posadasii RMSCC 3488]